MSDTSEAAVTSDLDWSSDAESFATVVGGLVTAHAPGSATITATHTPTGVFASTTVIVTAAIIESMVVAKNQKLFT